MKSLGILFGMFRGLHKEAGLLARGMLLTVVVVVVVVVAVVLE